MAERTTPATLTQSSVLPHFPFSVGAFSFPAKVSVFYIPLHFQPPVILSSNILQGRSALAFILPWHSSWGLVALARRGIILEMWEDLCLFSHLITALQQLPLGWKFLFNVSLYYSRFTEHSEWKLLPETQKTWKAKLLYIADARWDHQQKWGMQHLAFRLSFWKWKCWNIGVIFPPNEWGDIKDY